MTYDNLNRMTATPKVIPIGSKTSWAYNNDILGNRTGRNSNQSDASSALYSWDVLNRMLMQATPSAGGSYRYRADGQRIEKVDGPTLDWVAPPPLSTQSGHYDLNYGDSNPTSRYFYDGQMGIEDDYNPSGTVTVVNRYALGARGIDRVEKYADSTTTYGYPIYDGHGNMRTTLARSGSSYSTGTFKTYDVWGSVRSGGDSGDPAQKYVANLGHVNDPESGLIYMRARYHEPATGRFLSEDPQCQGLNWLVYCGNEPVNRRDFTGRHWSTYAAFALCAIGAGHAALGFLLYMFGTSLAAGADGPAFKLAAIHELQEGTTYFTYALAGIESTHGQNFVREVLLDRLWHRLFLGILEGVNQGNKKPGWFAFVAIAMYSVVIVAALVASIAIPED